MQHPHQNKILKDFNKLRHLYEGGAVFTAFDTETTGLSPSSSRIIEIGAVKFSKNGIISTWNHLFNPHMNIPQFVADLTHITDDMVWDCKDIKYYLPSFLSLIQDTILIAHNAQFDLNFLNAECEWAGYKPTHNKVIDTLQFSQFVFPTLEKHKLEYLADYFKLKKGSSHRAFDDADTCRQLFLKCIYPDKINF